MKRHLNTSYRPVWNHLTAAFVAASELARSRGKNAPRRGVSPVPCCYHLPPAPAADTVLQAEKTASGGTLITHDRQTVFRYSGWRDCQYRAGAGADSDDNTGGQQITPSGFTARNTTVTADGLQDVHTGGSATDTVIEKARRTESARAGFRFAQSSNGEDNVYMQAAVHTGTVINRDGYQTIKHGGLATVTIVNTGAEGGPHSEMFHRSDGLGGG
ncbi:ESPR-type extended signal peptide-containing protein [Escherichia coli]|nr:ESPR-type extended signal peptide-containing protein [Escherichia coli]